MAVLYYDSREANKTPAGMKRVTLCGGACDVEISRQRLLPVGENLAVVVHLDLQHLVPVQPAGYGPPESLEESRASDQRRKGSKAL